ncbi:uncharacterized protein [Antedon mediterranea]|uniref:uncharacterized protein n=1 Tax=Antedon mediterranea TaxID=105859 RepID=UPI003AF5A042
MLEMKAYSNTNDDGDGNELDMVRDRGSVVGVSCIVRQYEESRFIVTIPGLPLQPKTVRNSQTDSRLQAATNGANNHKYNLRSSRKLPKIPPKPVEICQRTHKDLQDAKNGNTSHSKNVGVQSMQIKQHRNCVLTEPVLLRIAEQLGSEWQSLLIHLGLKKAQIDLIKSETQWSGGLHQTIFRGLLKWKQRCRKEDKAVHQLQLGLQQVGRNDISEDLDEKIEVNGNDCSFQKVPSLQERVDALEKRVSTLERRRQCRCDMTSATDATDGGGEEEFEIVSFEEVGLAQDHYYTGHQNPKSSIQDWMECGLQRVTSWSYSVEHVQHEEEAMELDFGF